jgi:hypothetical protein
VLLNITNAIPGILEAVGKGIIRLAVAIAKGQGELTRAFTAILSALIDAAARNLPKLLKLFEKLIIELLDAIVKAAPKAAKAIEALIDGILAILVHSVPRIASAALQLLAGFLEAIAHNIGKVTKAGADIVIAWIQGIGDQSVRIVNAAFKAVIKFINGLADAIEKNTPQLRDAGKHLAFAIADGMTLGLASKVKDVGNSAVNLAKSALNKAKGWLHIGSPSKKFFELGEWSALGWILGLQKYSKASGDAGRNMVKKALDGASKEFKDAVKYILKDLPKDLVGGKDDVKNTIQNTSSLLHQAAQQSHQDMQQLKQDLHDLKAGRDDDAKAVRDANQAVDDAQAKLTKLTNAHNQNAKAIQQAKNELSDAQAKQKDAIKTQKDHEQAIKDDTAALAQATDEHTRAKLAIDEFNTEMDKHKARLIDLGKEYDRYTKKIDDAKQALQNAIQEEQQYRDQITQQYSTLPDIQSDTSVADYTNTLQDQVNNTQTFIDDLNALREQFGLSDDLYKQLLAKGPAILPFVEQLLAGGQAAVDQLNTLTAQLDAEAKNLGNTASKSLYQAGVDAAQGLLDGLESKRDAIEKKMQRIADIIAKAIRKALKIKSPSEVMHDIGEYTIQGLADGMASMESEIDKQGKRLVDKMNSYIQQINDALVRSETLTPTITPVLDLSGLQKNASQIGNIVATPIAVSSTFASASRAALGVQQNAAAAVAAATASPITSPLRELTFIQNNTSPKALSAGEIYRQTKNQISQAKGALTKNAS